MKFFIVVVGLCALGGCVVHGDAGGSGGYSETKGYPGPAGVPDVSITLDSDHGHHHHHHHHDHHRHQPHSFGVIESTYGAPPQDSYGLPVPVYQPPINTYGPPKQIYGPPKQIYGPPKQIYGPPPQIYGPPRQVYGPPKPTYGVIAVQPSSDYGIPCKHCGGYGKK